MSKVNQAVAVGVINRQALHHFSVILACIVMSTSIYAQEPSYNNKKLSETEISAVISYYTQDGDHSAVTGGSGTEKLNVYSVSYDSERLFDSIRLISFGLGLDYISSASTDRIDFKLSSASAHDQRIDVHVGYSQSIPKTSWSMGGAYSLSFESDYLSNGINWWASYLNSNKDTQVDINFQYYRDDLRWRKNVLKPTVLIYPVELRDTTWFDIHNRNSFNLAFSFRKDLNKRLTMAIFPAIIYQSGLLSTPFHRVYFEDLERPLVERLPRSRLKFPIGIQLNSFASSRIILKTYYQYYWDDFGISSHLFNLDVPYKLSSFVTITPSLRYYTQTSADYFNIRGAHTKDSEYYTSDYDLSSFHSMKFGFEFKSTSNKEVLKGKWIFDRFAIRYAYYKRSDNLDAHILSMIFDLSRNNSKVF